MVKEEISIVILVFGKRKRYFLFRSYVFVLSRGFVGFYFKEVVVVLFFFWFEFYFSFIYLDSLERIVVTDMEK